VVFWKIFVEVSFGGDLSDECGVHFLLSLPLSGNTTLHPPAAKVHLQVSRLLQSDPPTPRVLGARRFSRLRCYESVGCSSAARRVSFFHFYKLFERKATVLYVLCHMRKRQISTLYNSDISLSFFAWEVSCNVPSPPLFSLHP